MRGVRIDKPPIRRLRRRLSCASGRGVEHGTRSAGSASRWFHDPSPVRFLPHFVVFQGFAARKFPSRSPARCIRREPCATAPRGARLRSGRGASGGAVRAAGRSADALLLPGRGPRWTACISQRSLFGPEIGQNGTKSFANEMFSFRLASCNPMKSLSREISHLTVSNNIKGLSVNRLAIFFAPDDLLEDAHGPVRRNPLNKTLA